VSPEPGGAADFVITVGGTAERLACMQAQCGDLSTDCDCP
jgi:hypothetical protein